MIDWSAFFNERTGIVGLLTGIVIGFMTGFIVPGWMFRALQMRVEKLEAALMDTIGVTREAVDTAHTIVKRRSHERRDDEPA